MDARPTSEPGILRSRFFWKLFASFSAVAILTGAVVGWRVEARLEEGLLADLQENLLTDCRILAPFAVEAFRGGAVEGLQQRLERLKETGVRITLIRPDGQVIGESHEDPARMDDHSNRPEIVQARSERIGVVRRYSHTVGYELLYVALRFEDAGETLGFVRAALPVSLVQRQVGATTRSVVLGTAAGVLAALLLGLLFARWITRPIASMTRIARELSAGRYGSRVHGTRTDEIGLLGQTLNELGAEITRRIATLSQEDAQLRAVLASMIEGVVAVDEEDRVAFINQAARALLEIGEPAPVGRSLWDLAPIRELQDMLARARTTGSQEPLEVDLFRGGKERVFQVHASPFQGGGKGGFVLVLHDITELRRLERVRRDFVANVSHELKTPLTSIQGFVETLLSGALHDEHNNVQFLQRIDANVKRLTNLVTDLLSLSRIESGQLAVERTAVDWREVLDGVLRLREPALSAKGLRLDVLGRERALRVRGDKEAMTQVLDNLVDNAIQYTSAPGRITLRLSSQDGFGLMAVADTGIGIPSSDLDRVFERFYRVDKARSRAAGGTGLGLSIVKNLVLRMEGEVRVASVEGQGSTFTVLLPLA
jgi:two-component system phosphate regulon sensor histidine kinase PhoR